MAAVYPLDASRTAWISRGFEVLADRVHREPNRVHFDVLIVGSGYGGAVAADVFAGRTANGRQISVGVLERGTEYLSGAFPAGLRELPTHVRRERHRDGLFDIRLGPEVTTVVANGVGGGSLINAGVMEIPAPRVFAEGWPAALSSLPTWQQYFDRAHELLGSRRGGAPNTIRQHPDGEPRKYRALEAIAPSPERFRAAEITIAMTDTISSGNVALKRCIRCGDCATGCNFGAKNSLDLNLLARAQQKGAEIFSGATVLAVAAGVNGGWIVQCVPTNAKLRARDDKVTEIRAERIVLAAGTLGSTEILMRSQQAGLPVSQRLGERCSTNGDMLVAKYDTNADVHTVADEAVRPSERGVGPTITGVVDLRSADGGLVIEEMSVPAALRRAFTEIFATINTLHALDERDWSRHRAGFQSADLYGAPAARIERSALYAVMGDDGAAGTIELAHDDEPLTLHDDGVARIRWPADKKSHPEKRALQDLPVFAAQVDTLIERTKDTGGRLIPNPVWELLPKGMGWLLQGKRGPLLTVHPLGGCALADDAANGVVDDRGRVFDAHTGSSVHEGLVVLDGSIIPTALGTNPALTITAVALRASEALAADWGYAAAADAGLVLGAPPLERPVYRTTDIAFTPTPTEVEIVERLAGPVRFRAAGQSEPKTRIVEVTLRFEQKAVADLCQPARAGHEPVLRVADAAAGPIESRIRIYDEVVWREMEKRWSPAQRFERELEAVALFSAPLSGSLRVLERAPSAGLARTARAGWAWLVNRGLRDIYQAIVEKLAPAPKPKPKGTGVWSRIKSGIAVASRGGELRTLAYELEIGAPAPGAVVTLEGNRIAGCKRFTYARRGNPWRQLMEVELGAFPGFAPSSNAAILSLDLRHLARVGVPLFRITRQHDAATALAELASFVGYFVRLLLGLHIWSFRAPDEDASAREPQRLPPQNLPGLPPAEVRTIHLEPQRPAGGGKPFTGRVILTRYPRPEPIKRPLLMLHGYSASGTTFAHHAVPDNFASHFWQGGRDVWIADLRTSAAQEQSAEQPWGFEQIGLVDVPAAVEEVCKQTGSDKVDVIAHCMGAVVFSVAVLGGTSVSQRVGRAAFTQVGPLVVFAPANIFRGYVLRYFVEFLPDAYSFRPSPPTLADDLFDRLLATLPYPVEEFDIENPRRFWERTPWTRTRHRMDALYGRDFNVANMEPEMLRHIDDHFGPLSLRTVAQTLHFVRYSMITTFSGVNDFVSRSTLEKFWNFPTFSVHGADNGLAHVSTVDRMRAILEDAGRIYRPPHVIAGAGHQDALVGTKRGEALAAIEKFLDEEFDEAPHDPKKEMVAYAPWIGPIITEVAPRFVQDMPPERKDAPALVIRLGTAPTHRGVEGVVMIRVALDGDRALRPDDAAQAWDEDYVISHMVFYTSSALKGNRWDAFFAPLPELMPGFEPQSSGDALLVLTVYSESPLLAGDIGREYAYFRANMAARTTEELLPLVDATKTPLPDRVIIEFDVFERAAQALFGALQAQWYREEGDVPARARVGHPVLLAVQDQARVELPIPTAANPSALPSTGQLVFGTNTLAGAAVAAALDYEPGVADGIIPYDSPRPEAAAQDSEQTSFALMSCQYPAGFLDEQVAYASYRRLAERIDGASGIQPRFLVLTGDQVYVDPTAGLYDPTAADDRFGLPYEMWLRQRDVRSALRRVPSFMLLDDHEIEDNWEPLPPTSAEVQANERTKTLGLAAYGRFQRGRVEGGDNEPIGEGQSFHFRFDGFRFFMLDTRSTRTLRRVGALDDARLFDEAAFDALCEWLCEPEAAGRPKFVVTPAIFLPRHRRAVQHVPVDGGLDPANLSALLSDGWDGYPATLRAVLGFIARNRIEHVVFLSGDEHCGCVATVELRDAAGANVLTRLHSLHATAAYAPFPFANGSPASFVLHETIGFDHEGERYQCVVDARVPECADGALLLRPWATRDGAWKLDYEYAGGDVKTLPI